MSERPTFWLVILVTEHGGKQYELTPNPDTRKAARDLARVNRLLGHSAHVVKRHEWVQP